MNDSDSDSKVASKVAEISACILLVAACLALCNNHGYLDVSAWIIYLLVGSVVLFWSVALLLTFIVWVVVVARRIEKEMLEEEQERRAADEE